MNHNNHRKIHHITRSLIAILFKNVKILRKWTQLRPQGVFLCPTIFLKNCDLTDQDVNFLEQYFCCQTNQLPKKLKLTKIGPKLVENTRIPDEKSFSYKMFPFINMNIDRKIKNKKLQNLPDAFDP